MLRLPLWNRDTAGEQISRRDSPVFCPCCAQPSTFVVASKDRNRNTAPDVFEYFQCGSCRLVFMDPIPEDLRPFYEGGYRAIPKNIDELRALAHLELYRLKPLLKHKQSGRLLEIGPWMGTFSLNARDAGFDVSAIEIDQACVDFLNTEIGIRAVQSADPAATLEDLNETFDVIALWHCIEHLRQPWIVIEKAAQHLAPGGILLIALPNIESYEFSIFRAGWRNLDAPRHIYFFPANALVNQCRRHGLNRLELTTGDDLSHAFSLETWQTYARSVLPIRFLRGALGYTLKFFANRQERRDESGPGLTALFQRPSGS